MILFLVFSLFSSIFIYGRNRDTRHRYVLLLLVINSVCITTSHLNQVADRPFFASNWSRDFWWQNEFIVDCLVPKLYGEKSHEPWGQGPACVLCWLSVWKIAFHYICLTCGRDNCVQWLDWSVTKKSKMYMCEFRGTCHILMTFWGGPIMNEISAKITLYSPRLCKVKL